VAAGHKLGPPSRTPVALSPASGSLPPARRAPLRALLGHRARGKGSERLPGGGSSPPLSHLAGPLLPAPPPGVSRAAWLLLLGSGSGSFCSRLTSSLPGPAEELGMAWEGCSSVLDVEDTDYIFLVKKEGAGGARAREEAEEPSPRGLASGGAGKGWFPACFQ